MNHCLTLDKFSILFRGPDCKIVATVYDDVLAAYQTKLSGPVVLTTIVVSQPVRDLLQCLHRIDFIILFIFCLHIHHDDTNVEIILCLWHNKVPLKTVNLYSEYT